MALLTRIIAMNMIRLKSLLTRYNPITGKDAPGKRVRVVLADFMNGEELWIPVETFRSKFFRALVNCGSIEAYVERFMPDENKEKSRLAVLHRFLYLRCKHDFYFFAGAYARIKNKEGG